MRCGLARTVDVRLTWLSRPCIPQVHDIEELATSCRKATTCPYFAARDLALEAELVFCPYTYLVDPVVRAWFMWPI